MRLCGKSLRRAVENGRDADARADMMMAAIMGATAFQKGLGVTHSLAHPLSSIAGMHHGMANAILLPYVLAFNADASPQKYRDIARVLDLPQTPEAVVQWVRDLNAAVGIPSKLRAYGVADDMIPALVEKALLDGCYQTNPRRVTASDMSRLYHEAL
jgi:alcohol dehydrogenase class IV